MALSRRDRIRLKTQLIEALANPEWTWDRTNVLLSEFGFGSLSDDRFAPSIAEMITDATDEVVVEMYSVVMDVDADEVQEAVAIGADDGNWKRGYARVFLRTLPSTSSSSARWLLNWQWWASTASSPMTLWSTASRGRSRSSKRCARCRPSSLSFIPKSIRAHGASRRSAGHSDAACRSTS
ncbi:MAG: hypothetical protein U0P47_05875 [Acidimicrobiales bacterium]